MRVCMSVIHTGGVTMITLTIGCVPRNCLEMQQGQRYLHLYILHSFIHSFIDRSIDRSGNSLGIQKKVSDIATPHVIRRTVVS